MRQIFLPSDPIKALDRLKQIVVEVKQVAMDDTVPELLNAMSLIAETEQGPADQTPSMGCSIKWK